MCDTNKSGGITKSEAIKCGGNTFWEQAKAFDSNHDNILTWNEVYAADKYYDNRTLFELVSTPQRDDSHFEPTDVSLEAMKNFFDVSLLGQSLLSQGFLQQIDAVFQQTDSNRDGKLSKYEIIAASQKNGQPVTYAQLGPIFDVIDTNRDGFIEKFELINFYESPAQWTNLVFRYMDYNRDGYINFYEFKRFIQENKPSNEGMPSDAEIKNSIAQLDYNKDGRLSWSEVYQIMQQLQQMDRE